MSLLFWLTRGNAFARVAEHYCAEGVRNSAFGADDGQPSRLSFTMVESVVQPMVVGLIGLVPHTRMTLLWLPVTVRR
jgi:hypothetical protein